MVIRGSAAAHGCQRNEDDAGNAEPQAVIWKHRKSPADCGCLNAATRRSLHARAIAHALLPRMTCRRLWAVAIRCQRARRRSVRRPDGGRDRPSGPRPRTHDRLSGQAFRHPRPPAPARPGARRAHRAGAARARLGHRPDRSASRIAACYRPRAQRPSNSKADIPGALRGWFQKAGGRPDP